MGKVIKYDNPQKLTQLTGEVIDELQDLIKVKNPDDTERFRMTRLTSVLSAYSRIVEADAANRKVDLMIARSLAGDDDAAFERYVRRAFPSAARMLGSGE